MEAVLKKESKTSEEYGCDPLRRNIQTLLEYGVINLNKPSGPTSHQISEYVKNILNVKKAGHGGTLDPHVTGVLPIALEKAARIIHFLLTSGKEYVCLMYLHKDAEEGRLRKVFKEFSGLIEQVPPVKSAVKRVKRKRMIYALDILEVEGRHVLFKVSCQAGTYIRKLVHEMGQKLESGAHMAQLIRVRSGSFMIDHAVTLHDLLDAFYLYEKGDERLLRKCILPIEEAVNDFPKIWVHDSAVETLCHGANLNIPAISKLTMNFREGDFVAILTLKGELVAVGKAMMETAAIAKQERGLAVKVNKVLMDPGTYPRYRKPTEG